MLIKSRSLDAGILVFIVLSTYNYDNTDSGTAQKILSLARYLLATNGQPLPGITAWQYMHPLPYEDGISEDTCHELFGQVDPLDAGLDQRDEVEMRMEELRQVLLRAVAIIRYDLGLVYADGRKLLQRILYRDDIGLVAGLLRKCDRLPCPDRIKSEDGISEDTCHELFGQVGRDGTLMQNFFASRLKALGDKALLAYDSTTIPPCSSQIPEARHGFNKAHDGRETVKLLALYSVVGVCIERACAAGAAETVQMGVQLFPDPLDAGLDQRDEVEMRMEELPACPPSWDKMYGRFQ